MGDSSKTEINTQELEKLGSDLEAKLLKPKDSLEEGDLEALNLLLENLSTCCFKFRTNKDHNKWNSPIPLGTSDQQSNLCTFLALLWQAGKMKQVAYDPIDLPITSNGGNREVEENIKESISFDNNCENIEDDEEAFTEDGINYLNGPYEIDMSREDLYHSLFATFRKSCERRQRHFLNSKHLLQARKLSGLDTYRYGTEFCVNVLIKAAPSLEELEVDNFDMKNLHVFHNLLMPKLRRLNLWLRRVDEETESSPIVFPSCGLRYLRAHIPRTAFESLLKSNSKTLLELHLKVGTAHCVWERWPNSCRNLDEMLLCCKGTLRRLVLIRDLYVHTRASCQDQVEAIKLNLPGLNVICEYCCSK